MQNNLLQIARIKLLSKLCREAAFIYADYNMQLLKIYLFREKKSISGRLSV
ncbi:hypothetical protein AcetOrient_orf01618 [Acetobacter orientalis]|uniref:Uncharacterized protein n=1 Tax=Acetobacter orientalis TaxID=146474 RepID=A0A2Z5ZFU4_9PROT|nr:hypothetical protein AcetOrient_orf01618 [Acetobacter orientalis]